MIPEVIVFQKTTIPVEVTGQVEGIYESSFPAPERAPFTSILEGIELASSVMACSLMDGAVIGFGVGALLSQGGIFFLGYIAIQQSSRGRGHGSLLIDALLTHLKSTGVSGILLEVEDPKEADTTETLEQRVKRIRFYEKCGGWLVEDGGVYRMPDLTGPGSLGMRLMWIPAVDRDLPALPLPLRKLFNLIYAEMYGLTMDDPLVKAVLAQLP